MTYDIKMLQGIATLTQEWEYRREAFFQFACDSDDDRWQRSDFRNHMYYEYIKTDTPITTRFYSLDAKNQGTLLRYIEEYLMAGMASINIDYNPRNA